MWLGGWSGGWGQVNIKDHLSPAKLELGLSLAIKAKMFSMSEIFIGANSDQNSSQSKLSMNRLIEYLHHPESNLLDLSERILSWLNAFCFMIPQVDLSQDSIRFIRVVVSIFVSLQLSIFIADKSNIRDNKFIEIINKTC